MGAGVSPVSGSRGIAVVTRPTRLSANGLRRGANGTEAWQA